MKTIQNTITITIEPAPSSLTKYTHAASQAMGEAFARRIDQLEAAGYSVLWARGSKASVPNSYGPSAHRMNAPFWVYDPDTRSVRMIPGNLETRPRGARIPARYEIAGDKVPDGFRCLTRNREAGTITICIR